MLGLGAHPPRLAAETVPRGPLSADQAAPEPGPMGNAVIIAFHLDPNAPTPHGVDPVQPFYRRIECKPQTSHGVLGINRNRVAAVRMRV